MSSPENVDPNEIAKFESVASRWWDIDGEFKPLHRLNPLRLEYIQLNTDGVFGKKVLDVGCGGGILSESLAREGAHVTGLDMAHEPLAVARLHAEENGLLIDYQQSTVEAHAENHAGQYDIVTCMELLEHVPNPASVVRACAQLVKPGGHVFFSTINRNAKAWLMLIVGAEYLLNLVPKGTHHVDKFIRPSELIDWISATSLQERHITGICYQPLSQTFQFTQNVDVNYLLHCTRKE